MLRTLLGLIALAIIVAIVLSATGIISLRQTQEAQAPAFDVNVKQVGVGTTTKNVQVPSVEIKTKQIEVPTLTVSDGNEANQQ
jgi:hypothetical protein